MKKNLLTLALLVVAFSVVAQTDSLHQAFLNPPNAAQPRVWWHWMNGNITKDGIRKDLLWMKHSGVGGFQNFDASLATPQIVSERLTYMTPEWKDAFLFTTKLADSLGLEMAIAGSPGWSETGGPWVRPDEGMKKLVWTETRVKGGASKIKLAAQAGITGPFQNIVKLPGFAAPVDASKLPVFYRDAAVIAFKLPAADKSLQDLKATVTSSGGAFTLEQLTDGDLSKSVLLPRDSTKGLAWIQFTFPQPTTINAISIVGGGYAGIFGMGADPKDARALEVSDDGINFKQVCLIIPGGVLQQTINIPATMSRFFRVTLKNPPVKMNNFFGLGNGAPPVTPPGTEIAEVVLHPVVRVHMFEEKDAFVPDATLASKTTLPTKDVVAQSDVIDLTDKMSADGILNWKVPPGEWKILRFGYSLLGINNHPASPEATGLEVDKLDPVAVRRYFQVYLDQYKDATGGLMGKKGLQYVVTDSWEAGGQNWTVNFPAEFDKRRGYNMRLWMPVLAGHVVKSAEASEQFLFDFRKTLSDMVAEYHYDALTTILDERGMKRYSESHENGRALIADGMEVKRTAAIPMSAIWTPNVFINQNDLTYHTADIRESASVAHIYGQNLVAAESLTALGMPNSAWSYSPEILKPTADLALAHGLNRFVIHTSVHQPVDDKIPGLGLGPFGQWFNRHDTWAQQAKVWTDYLSRSSYLLQQGKFVADVVYYYGDDNNITGLFGKGLPSVPEGYNFDFINSDALINVLTVKDGKLITPSGMSYHLLVLGENVKRISLPVMKKIQALVTSGASISGTKPEASPSLSDDPAEFTRIVNEVWNPANDKVFQGKPLKDVLASLKVKEDMIYSKPHADTKLFYVHRKTQNADIYWINNRNDRAEEVEVQLRVDSRVPELWHPETGQREPVTYSMSGGSTKVNLQLTPSDAVFLIFRNNTSQTSVSLPPTTQTVLTTVPGPWAVSFQSGRGAPSQTSFNNLISYSDHPEAGIKYFSGTATYTKRINAEKSWLSGNKVIRLDLGEVKNLAEVIVNGKSLGIIWRKPFRVDVASALKAGENMIEIKVTNLWVNRLIGDQQPGATAKFTYTTMPFYQANSPLVPSGLLGPVKLIALR